MWSGVPIPHQTSFANLQLWLAWFLPGFCRLSATNGTELAAERGTWLPFAAVHGSAFAYLTVRPTPDGTGHELGARAYGTDRFLAAEAMIAQVQAWDGHGRHTTPAFAYWPADGDHTRISAGTPALNKRHGVLTICWPEPG
jgi:protein-L-isoaspartate(D-aspartate) O-methyltransferase